MWLLHINIYKFKIVNIKKKLESFIIHKRIMYYIRGTEPSNTDPVFDEIMEKENKY